jgi:protein-S-isoprenylcysteine O-methyltransferase Ste14
VKSDITFRARQDSILPPLGLRTGALTVLLAVVALASRAGLGGGTTATARSWAGSTVDVLVVVALVLAAATVVVLIYAFTGAGRGGKHEELMIGGRPQRSLGLKLLALACLALLAAAIVAVILIGRDSLGGPAPALPANPVTTRPVPAPAPARPAAHAAAGPLLPWWLVVAVVAVAVAGTAAFLWWRPHRERVGAIAAEARRARAALDQSLAELDDQAEPRAAVIRAYARMEQVLSEHELPRGVSEAPREYMTRALSVLGAPVAAARRLTELYEEARFSCHAIDARMRSDAITTLRTLRAQLGGKERTR